MSNQQCPMCGGTGARPDCITTDPPDVAAQVVEMLILNSRIESVRQDAIRMIREAIRRAVSRNVASHAWVAKHGVNLATAYKMETGCDVPVPPFTAAASKESPA